MKKIIQFKLKILAKLILKKYQPKIIGISGSVGKTSSKEAIYAVLKNHYKVRRSLKNYNNEIGLPLSIIGEETQGHSILGWIAVFLHAFNLILFKDKNYPEILILEMGIDSPGDMDYLNSIVKLDIAILTLIGLVHVAQFNSHEDLIKEKGKLFNNLKKDAWAIFNLDDDKQENILKNISGKKISYGFNENAQMEAKNIKFFYNENNNYKKRGISFQLKYEDRDVDVFLPDILSSNMIYSALVGASVAVALNLSLEDIAKDLFYFQTPPGRLKIIKGIKNTLIIDDTYNSEPHSSLSALYVLSNFFIEEQAQRFAVLGDMLELGSYSVESHKNLGQKVFELGIDKLICVGERSLDIKKGAIDAGMSFDDIYHFDNSDEAKSFLQDRIKTGDLILVKGSQGMRMEKIVKEIMADPLRASELLVRQGEGWQ